MTSVTPWALILSCLYSITTTALDLTPRQWSHLPTHSNFIGIAFANTQADIAVDPVQQLENVEMDLDTWAVKYIRTFPLLTKSARVDVTQGYQEGRWSGLLRGSPASVQRSGLADTFVRLAVNLYGAPPLNGKEFTNYRRTANSETIIGAALAVRLPTGDYDKNKLINLGKNRYSLRPQLGIQHTSGQWSAELTAEVAFFSDNDKFYNGNKLEQDHLYILHGHVMHNFRPGHWIALSAGIDHGGESNINGIEKDNQKRNTGWALTYAIPINRKSGVNIGYIQSKTHKDIGSDTDTFVVAFSRMW
jgi:Putative MetA-pathway of phenol degradation